MAHWIVVELEDEGEATTVYGVYATRELAMAACKKFAETLKRLNEQEGVVMDAEEYADGWRYAYSAWSVQELQQAQ